MMKRQAIRILIILVTATFVIEFGIMTVVLRLLGHPTHLSTAWLDSALLVLALFPVLLLFIYRPLSSELEKRKKAEEQFRRIFEFSPNALLAIVDAQGTILLVNPQVEKVFGYRPEELVGQKIEVLVPERFRAAHPGLRNAFMQAPQSRALGAGRDLYGRRKDGAEVPVEIALTPIGNGPETVILTTVTDITARKRLEEAQRYQLELNKGIMEHAPGAIFVTDEQGRITFVNPEVENIFGFTSEDLVGRVMHAMIHHHHPDGRPFPMSECKFSRVYKYGEVFQDCEDVFFHKNGSKIEVLGSNVPLEINGERIGAVLIVRDITERKREQELIRESRQTLRTVFDSAYDGILLHSVDGRVLDVNDRCLEMYALDREKMLQTTIADISGESNPIASLPALWEEVMRGETRFFEWKARRPTDRSEFDVEVFLRKLCVQGKEVVLANIRDITRRKETERQLREALSLRDEFLSIASHELKTPLTSLKLQVQLRQRYLAKGDMSIFTPEGLSKMTGTDDRQLDRLTRLVDDMLDVSRFNSGRLTIEKQTFDLCALAKEVAEQYSGPCKEIGSTLTCRLPEPVFGEWDRNRMVQVLANLLSNAIKYGAGTPITVSVGKTASFVEVQVRDEGRGISQEDQERVFQRFERAVTGSEVSGLGLGLYIVKTIVGLHGGSIRVESELGRGAAFTVSLPL